MNSLDEIAARANAAQAAMDGGGVMYAGSFRVTKKDFVIDIECKFCLAGMSVGNGTFGEVMIQEFIKQHKCYKPKGKQ